MNILSGIDQNQIDDSQCRTYKAIIIPAALVEFCPCASDPKPNVSMIHKRNTMKLQPLVYTHLQINQSKGKNRKEHTTFNK